MLSAPFGYERHLSLTLSPSFSHLFLDSLFGIFFPPFQDLDDGELYACKEMSKTSLISDKAVQFAFKEKNILSRLNCPTIVSLHWAIQDEENLYMVMPAIRRTRDEMR